MAQGLLAPDPEERAPVDEDAHVPFRPRSSLQMATQDAAQQHLEHPAGLLTCVICIVLFALFTGWYQSMLSGMCPTCGYICDGSTYSLSGQSIPDSYSFPPDFEPNSACCETCFFGNRSSMIDGPPAQPGCLAIVFQFSDGHSGDCHATWNATELQHAESDIFTGVCQPSWWPAFFRSSSTPGWTETLLGASTAIVRLGSLMSALVMKLLLTACGYRGATLMQALFSPRRASAAAATAQAVDEAEIPTEASWNGIVARLDRRHACQPNQPTWRDALVALGLTDRQGIASSISKFWLWHMLQPFAYFYVLMGNYCALGGASQFYGATVAVRELLYVLSATVALAFCPVFLLVELPSIRVQRADESESCMPWWLSRRGCASVDWQAVGRWLVYILAPHVFVQLCIIRRLSESIGDAQLHNDLEAGLTTTQKLNMSVQAALNVVIVLQTYADFCSMCALGLLAVSREHPLLVDDSGIFALQIGYFLTTLSLLVVVCGYISHMCVAPNRGWRGNVLIALAVAVALLAGGAVVLTLFAWLFTALYQGDFFPATVKSVLRWEFWSLCQLVYAALGAFTQNLVSNSPDLVRVIIVILIFGPCIAPLCRGHA